jgi:hypothetical protein
MIYAAKTRPKSWLGTLLPFLLVTMLAGPAHAQMLMNGAVATFPFPIYSKWFDEYAKVDPSVRVNDQSIGSGGGIRQITERTVDFGASDGPMNGRHHLHLGGLSLQGQQGMGAEGRARNVRQLAGRPRR